MYKNPNNWKKENDKSFSYGVQDSVGRTYKDLINEYDDKNRLIKRQTFSLYEDEKYQNPVLTNELIYKYQNDSINSFLDDFF